jgi:hypothetical protein
MPSSHISKIAVLQSLPADEMPTGKRLCEDVEIINLFHDRELKIQFLNVPTKRDFLVSLIQLEKEATAGIYPLLHIECHGSADQTGIILADDSFLAWTELKPYFTGINVATRCNLLIVLAACYGGYLGQIILPTERAPCWALIGPTDKVLPHELLSGFGSFYSIFLGTLDGDKSLESLTAKKLKSGRYSFTSAGGFFRIAYANYLANYCTSDELDKRAAKLSRKLRKMGTAVRPGKGAIRRLMRRTEESSYEKYYKKFFMIDLYPENAARFPLTFSEVKAARRILAGQSKRIP